MPKSHDRFFLFADDFHVADACAHQFYADAIARLQTLEPTTSVPESPSSRQRKPLTPYRILSFVARTNAAPVGNRSVVDLLELENRVNAKFDPSACAIFEPDEYPGLVWLDVSSGSQSQTLEPDMLGGPGASSEVKCEMKTIIFPSGAIVVHGSSMENMEESVKKKLPLIQKCMREAPPAIEELRNAAHSAGLLSAI